MIETSGEKYNRYKHNQTAVCWCVINSILTLAYIGEVIKGLKTFKFAVLFLLICWLPCITFMTARKSGKVNDDGLEYIAGIGYLIFYVFAVLSTNNYIVFVYIFPMLCILTVYCNRRLNAIVMSLTLFVNVIVVMNNVFIENKTAPLDITTYEVQLSCIALCTVFLWRSSKVLILRDKMIMQLSDEAYYDTLTRLHNRAYLEMVENDYAMSGKYIAGVAMLDIDRFKRINDVYGHKSGDRALQFIALKLKEVTDECGECVPIRIGGDEFVIIGTSKDMGKLEKACEKAVTNICEGVVKAESGEDIKITASMGVIRGQEGKRFRDLYNAVDEALYKAKSDGRNRVVTVGKDW